MSLQGLYRSLLYHVLSQCPALIPEIPPDQWRKAFPVSCADSSTLDSEMFRPPDIENAFDQLMKMSVSSDKFRSCFFIDGLDEYDVYAYD